MKMVALGEVADFINGFAFKPEDWHDRGIPIIRIQNLTDSHKSINFTSRNVPDKFHVRRGELLVSWSATLGVFVWNRTEVALVNQHIFRVVPHEHVDQGFLRHMLEGALVSMQRHLHGATMKHVNRSEFLSTEIPLPPIAEQLRIATILDHADALRVKRRQVLAHLDTLTQSIFHDMFGVLGDERWARAPFEEVVSRVENGASPNCEARPAREDEWGILKLGAVTYGVFQPTENKAYVGKIGSMARNEVQPDDVLMTRKNTRDLVGAVALVDEVRPRLLLPDLIFRLHLDKHRLNRRYFQALMMNPRTRVMVRDLSSGSAASMPNISKARLAAFPIEVPPLDLQHNFAVCVKQVGKQRVTMQRDLAAGDELFASLQSRAFRGEL